MSPALISALISAGVVLFTAVGWLFRLRAAVVDVLEEIQANERALATWAGELPPRQRRKLTFDAEDRSIGMLRLGCSKATYTAVQRAYREFRELDPTDETVAFADIADARAAAKHATTQLEQSLDPYKWRRTERGDTKPKVPRVPPVFRAVLLALVVVPVLVFVLVDNDDDGKDGGGGNDVAVNAPVVKALDPAIMADARGSVTMCTGKDVSRARTKARDDFNNKFGPSGLRAQIKEFPEQADQQYEAFRALQRAKSGECDVFFADVVWSADFAQQGWLHDLSRYVAGRKDEFVPAMLETVTFDKKRWGVPVQADVGLLFYRTDKISSPPTTWQELYAQSKPNDDFRYQARAYEGLTVNFLEVAYAAGAEDIVTSDGKANIDQPRALDALRFMVEGIREGAAPAQVVVQKEEQSRRAFVRGRALFMRNWPYVYAADRHKRIGDRMGVVALPSWDGGIRASVLGGQNVVISQYSKNPAAALKLVDYLSGREIGRQNAVDYSLAPVLSDLWDDPAVRRALPAAEELEDAIRDAKPRPVTPNYQAVSRAIHTNVNSALQLEVTPEAALAAANDQMNQALEAIKPPGPG